MLPPGLAPGEMMHAVRAALQNANDAIRAEAARLGSGTIGATVVVLIVTDGHFVALWAGDSRLYRLRDGEVELLTTDHSVVAALVLAGKLSWDEAERHPQSNAITRAVGVDETLELDKVRGDVASGDRLLLCSDGLSGMVRTEELREVLVRHKESLDACRELTDRANRAGGHDNITVIVAEFDGSGLPDNPQADHSRGTPGPAALAATERSDEAARESRRLKVGHTMVGIQFSLPDAAQVGGARADTAGEVARYSPHDEPVSIPIDGLPPALVGFMVIAAMIVVACAGFLLLR
jgi:serine/threonine protein phosphatase PrpC